MANKSGPHTEHSGAKNHDKALTREEVKTGSDRARREADKREAAEGLDDLVPPGSFESRILLGAQAWDELQAQLAEPPAGHPGLQQLLAEPSVLEAPEITLEDITAGECAECTDRSALDGSSCGAAHREPEPAEVTWGSLWARARRQDGSIVRMHRKGQRCRWFDDKGEQIGPEQANAAPGLAYAYDQGWRVL